MTTLVLCAALITIALMLGLVALIAGRKPSHVR